jgi:octaprenyl-diphosphate synthase
VECDGKRLQHGGRRVVHTRRQNVTLVGALGDDFREGKITLPVVLSFRRGSEEERNFWRRTLEKGDIQDGDLETALATMRKHRALDDTVERAKHYGAMARDALEIFPASDWKQAMLDVVDFCIARAH